MKLLKLLQLFVFGLCVKAGSTEIIGLQNFHERLGTMGKDGPVLVYFFATWCNPCQKQKVWLSELHLDKKINSILAVSSESASKLQNFDAFPLYLDMGGVVRRHFEIPGYPSLILFDIRGGKVFEIWRSVGLTGKREIVKALKKGNEDEH